MAKAKYDENISRILTEIDTISKSLPKGTYHRITNRISKLKLILNKKHTHDMITFEGETHDQIAKRYVAIDAIFQAMTKGRHISLMDSQEFKVSQMHTCICAIRKKLNRHGGFELKDKWIKTNNGDRCKEYWFEPIMES